ncbi:protein Jade-1 [Anguilla anguilla]|uniref:protein Jade-1 n=1 Tax=Anguilla anguilla TaxID=7936 RepID=UPI0015A870F5|nr:protein Jade-1 [Anguilla anguilla]XP_035274255.1 protein Jade-1 [Anguilla anguilla]
MKRSRHPSSSEDSDDGSNGTAWSLRSKSPLRGNTWSRSEGRKPSEVFRTDLITAMKLHDSCQLNPEEYYVLADPWRQEWEKGVQVPVSPHSIPQPAVRTVAERGRAVTFTKPKKLIRMPGSEPPVLGYVDICTLADATCRYDLSEGDVAWLELANQEFREMGMKTLDEITMERVMEEFERRCYDNMSHAMETEEGLGIEYDEDVVCDVCRSPHGEDGNEMVFCDKCDICVHQACYGIMKVPEGSWLCRICALGVLPKCLLCPKKGGAMKPTRSATKWVHVSCALWIPEVSIGNPEKMEPIMNISRIPSNRWALQCCLCKEKTGACIQCSAKNCRTAFHVTCALQRNLEMNTVLTETDEVKFKSFCPKHSHCADGGAKPGQKEEEEEEEGRRRRARGGDRAVASQDGSPRRSLAPPAPTPAVPGVGLQEAPELSQRKLKLQQLNDEFFTLVPVGEVSRQLQLPEETVDFLFQYWKLKRRANFNRPLLTPRKDEEDDLAKREQDVLLRRLKLFTHLRQDLERVRNLTYMVTRREKIKRSMCRVHEQIFHHHVRLLEEKRLSGVSSSACLEDALFFSWVSSLVSKPKRPQAERASHRREWRKGGARSEPPKPPHAAADVANARAPASYRPEGRKTTPAPPKPAIHREAGPKAGEGPVTRAGPECPRRRGGPRGEERRDGLRERAPPKAKPRPNTAEAPANKLPDKRAVVGALLAPGVGNLNPCVSLERLPRCNGSLRRVGCGPNSPVPPPSPGTSPASSTGTAPPSSPAAGGGHGKNWGSFRIPKKSVRLLRAHPPGPNGTPPPAPGHAHTRAPHGPVPAPQPGRSERDAKGKKCHAQPPRGHAPITRRYGTDFLRPGILAS